MKNLNEIGKRIKEKRLELKMTQEELAFKTGYTSRSSINKIELGIVDLPQSKIVALSEALKISPAYLMGWEVFEVKPNLKTNFSTVPPESFEIGTARIPLVGQVVAGIPVETSEYLESYITVDYPNPHEYFALRVKGDSMIGAGIKQNDILVVKKQNYAENGDIVVACVNGESTVKRYRVSDNQVVLFPENSNYMPIIVKGELIIFGKVVEIRSKI